MKVSTLLVTLSVFLLASAAPSDTLSRRADYSPGLGVELELRALHFENPDKERQPPPQGKCSPEEVSRIKGAAIQVLDADLPGSSKNDWALTAEHCGTEDQTGTSCLVSEFIIDGTKVKVGDNRAKVIGDEILKFLQAWKPSKKAETQVKIESFEQCGKWNVEAPPDFSDVLLEYKFLFGQQVTAAMPLEGIQALFVKAKSKQKDTLLGTIGRRLTNMHQVRKEDFAQLVAIKPSDINDEFLGFFSTVVSYAKAGPGQAADEGPKTALVLMPRTDHAAIYKAFIQKKLNEQLKCNSLFEIVTQLASFRGDGSDERDQNFNIPAFESAKFQWDNGAKGDQKKHAELLVKDWLQALQDDKGDKLAENDKVIDGQIGRLGDRMEYLYKGSHDRLVPIWEFRDLGSSNTYQLHQALEGFEKAIVDAHAEYSKPPAKLKVRDPEVKRDNKCKKLTVPPPTPATHSPPPPPPPPPPPSPATDSCDVAYQFFDDYFEIRGKNFDASKLGKDGEGLKGHMKHCGALTSWKFTWTPKDPTYEWYAHGKLPIGTKSCVGSGVEASGGTSHGNCHGPG